MKQNIKEQLTLENCLSAIAIFISIILFIFSFRLNIKTNRLSEELNDKTNKLTEKVNSKEYQMSENLKYELLKVVADLKSIESKAAIEQFMSMSVDYSKEVEDISYLRTSPGYLLYLNSIESEEERQLLDMTLLMLTHPTNALTAEHKRGFSHYALDILRNKTSMDSISMSFSVLLNQLCDMRLVAPKYVRVEIDEEGVLETFLRFLLEKRKVDDVDVLSYYGRITNDTTLLKQTANEGADLEVTLLEIIKRYQTEYEEFVLSYSDQE